MENPNTQSSTGGTEQAAAAVIDSAGTTSASSTTTTPSSSDQQQTQNQPQQTPTSAPGKKQQFQHKRSWHSNNQNDRGGNKRKKSGDGGDEEAESGDDAQGGVGGKRVPKKKCAILTAYRGTNYVGLQLQTGFDKPTIEGEFLKALHKAGCISDDNIDDTQKIKFVRAARTDKGVHAAGNLFSAMIMMPDNLVELVNTHLPPDIRCLGYCRVLGSFHAKYSCTSRMYQYIIPSFVFSDLLYNQGKHVRYTGENLYDELPSTFVYPDEIKAFRLSDEQKARLQSLLQKFVGTRNYMNFTRKKNKFLQSQNIPRHERRERKNEENNAANNTTATPVATDSSSSAAPPASSDTPTPDTSTVTATPSSSSPAPTPAAPNNRDQGRNQNQPQKDKRGGGGNKKESDDEGEGEGVDDLAAEEAEQRERVRNHTPLLRKGDKLTKENEKYVKFLRYIMKCEMESTFVYQGVEFVRINLHGQSFILNQIRKMIGLVIVMMNNLVHESYLETAFSFDDYAVPTAPSLGLLLDRPIYEFYDKKVQGVADRPSMESMWQSCAAEREKFRHEYIFSEICDKEINTGSAFYWVSHLADSPTVVQYLEDKQNQNQVKQESQAVAAPSASAIETSTSTAQPNPSQLTPPPATDISNQDVPIAAATTNRH